MLHAAEVDSDGDGWVSCTPDENAQLGLEISGGGDCDDANDAVYPGAPETCDGVDQDCDGVIDEVADGDLDGFTVCEEDCDDGSADTYPGAYELCDGQDNDCDGLVDESEDADGDGVTRCEGEDCDDDDASNFPGNAEVCDGQDNDCDDTVDNGLTVDADGDGHTVPEACEGTKDDCDDGDAGNFPGNPETCDGADNDCDGIADNGLTFDTDGDGHSTSASCAGTKDDCDDDDPSVYLNAEEDCADVKDNDCDGIADECPLTGRHTSSAADVRFISAVSGDNAGYKVAAAGDTDGDGTRDLLISANRLHDWGGFYLIGGSTELSSLQGSTLQLDPIATESPVWILSYVSDSNPSPYAGGEIAAGANLDGSGADDILVGHDEHLHSGAAIVKGLSPEDREAMTPFRRFEDSEVLQCEPPALDYFGNAVAVGGDFVNVAGEHAIDIAVGQWNESWTGGVLIYPGPFPSTSALAQSEVAVRLSGTAASDLGTALSFVGDVNDDGCDDLMVGGPLASNTYAVNPTRGAAFLVYGQCATADPVDIILNDQTPGTGYVAFVPYEEGYSFRLGTTFAGPCDIGDPNTSGTAGDRRPDLIMGDPEESPPDRAHAGAVYVVYGESLPESQHKVIVPSTIDSRVPVITLRGESAGDRAGSSVACAGDFNNDGVDDIIVGAPEWSPEEGGDAQGAAYIVFGETDGAGIGEVVEGERPLNTADLRIYGRSSDRKLGISVAGVGDVNGDGYDDVLIGALRVDDDGFGGAYLIFGGPRER